MACVNHSHDADSMTTISLHPYIDRDQSYCLNESVPNSGVHILRPHSERILPDTTEATEATPVTVISDPYDPDDAEEVELLLHVKFSEAVNMSSLCVCGRGSVVEVGTNGNGATMRTAAPWKCKLFANRTDLDFDMARQLKGDVELELLPPEHTIEQVAAPAAVETYLVGGSEQGMMTETVDYPVRGTKFQYCDNVTLYFGDNYSSLLLEDNEVTPTEITYVGFKGVTTHVKRKAVKAVYESRGMTKDHKVPDGEFGAKHAH